MVEPCTSCTDRAAENAALVDELVRAHRENARLQQLLDAALQVAQNAAIVGRSATRSARAFARRLMAREGP
jgi:hypothetical protein